MKEEGTENQIPNENSYHKRLSRSDQNGASRIVRVESEEIQVLSDEPIDNTISNNNGNLEPEKKPKTSLLMNQNILKMEKDILPRQEEEKSRAQLAAATRSIRTNLILGAIFISVLSILLLVPAFWRPYFFVVVFTVMRGSMPMLTAIANFGTVKFVALQYLDSIYHTMKLSFLSK